MFGAEASRLLESVRELQHAEVFLIASHNLNSNREAFGCEASGH